MKLAVLTAAHGRHPVFKLFLNSIPDFVYPIIVGSPDDNYKYWKDNAKGMYIIVDNKPLGKKWNTGLKYAKNIDFDYLIITGSDDIFCLGLWEHYKTLTTHFFGLLDFYFYEHDRIKYTQGYTRNRFGETHGAGRALHRNILESVEWKLWDDNINIALDASMTEKLSNLKYSSESIRLVDKGFVAMSVKTKDNLHTTSEYEGRWLDADEQNWILTKLGM